MMKILPKMIRPMSNVVFVMCRKTEVELTSVMLQKGSLEEKNSVRGRKKNSLCPCPLEDSEGTEEVFIPRSSIAGFLPFLPLFFSVVVDS